MRNLNFNEITKIFYSGENQGKFRFHKITEKINKGSPFEFINGSTKVLTFKDTDIKKAYETEDVKKISKYSTKRYPAFIDEDGNPVGLTELSKTNEFKTGTRKLDPHELMTASLILLYGSEGETKVPRDAMINLNNEKLGNLKKKAKEVKNLPNNAEKIIDLFSSDYESYAKAISCANGFLSKLKGKVTSVYATGTAWGDILSEYKIDDHLLFPNRNYNASDIIVEIEKKEDTGKKKVYVGVSLKKKGIGLSKDPTMINKAVVGVNGLLTALNDKDLSKDIANIYEKRKEFFYNVICSALTSNTESVKEYAKKKLLPSANNSLNNDENIKKYLEKHKKSNEKTILYEAKKLGTENIIKSLKGKYPDKEVENIYFKAYDEIFTNTKYHKSIVISILNIIFKTDLIGLLNKKKVPDEFKYVVILGVGGFKDGKILAGKPELFEEHFTTSFISDRIKDNKTTYKIEKTKGKIQAFEERSSAAKLYYTVYLSDLDIADIEIRYKGSITSEPQFQAFITPKFKKEFKTYRKKGGGNEQKW